MPLLTDPDRLAAYLDALANWRVRGYIEYDLSTTAKKYLVEQGIGELSNLSRLMFEFVSNGGKIDEVVETRPEWAPTWEYHHDLRLRLNQRLVYIETRLVYRIPLQPDESVILVVNIHDA